MRVADWDSQSVSSQRGPSRVATRLIASSEGSRLSTEPTHVLRSTSYLIDAADIPLATGDDVVRAVLVYAGVKAGRAGTPSFFSAVERDDDLFPSLQVFHLDHAVRISGLQRNGGSRAPDEGVLVEANRLNDYLCFEAS